jgi:hypothetical protein
VTAVRQLGPAQELWLVSAEDGAPESALASARPALLYRGLARADADARAHAARTRVRAADPRAVTCALHAREFDALRDAGLVLLVPAALLAEDGAAPRTTAELAAVRVASRGGPPAAWTWRGDRRSPELECEPAAIRVVRVTAQSGAPTGAAPRLAWQAREPLVERGLALGAWIEGTAAPQAWFDLEHDLGWLLGRRIARVSCEGELAQLATAELLPAVARDEPAGVAADARPADGTWSGSVPSRALPSPLRGAASWTLVLVDLDALASTRCALELMPDGTFTAPASAEFTARARARGTRALEWSLEYGVGSVTLLRCNGRAEL